MPHRRCCSHDLQDLVTWTLNKSMLCESLLHKNSKDSKHQNGIVSYVIICYVYHLLIPSEQLSTNKAVSEPMAGVRRGSERKNETRKPRKRRGRGRRRTSLPGPRGRRTPVLAGATARLRRLPSRRLRKGQKSMNCPTSSFGLAKSLSGIPTYKRGNTAADRIRRLSDLKGTPSLFGLRV